MPESQPNINPSIRESRVQQDAGRTSITTNALRILAVAYARENQDAESLSCFAWGLEIDPGDDLAKHYSDEKSF